MSDQQTVTMDKPIEFLTVKDRCDRCGAQAYIAIGVGKGELLMCFHHWKAHRDHVGEKGYDILVDDLHKVGAVR